jgi:hypothetical protein
MSERVYGEGEDRGVFLVGRWCKKGCAGFGLELELVY